MALELAEHGAIQEAYAVAGTKEQAALLAAKIQTRKSLRTLLVLSGPTYKGALVRPVLPAGMDSKSIMERVANMVPDEICS